MQFNIVTFTSGLEVGTGTISSAPYIIQGSAKCISSPPEPSTNSPQALNTTPTGPKLQYLGARHTVYEINPALPHNKEYTIIPIA